MGLDLLRERQKREAGEEGGGKGGQGWAVAAPAAVGPAACWAWSAAEPGRRGTEEEGKGER